MFGNKNIFRAAYLVMFILEIIAKTIIYMMSSLRLVCWSASCHKGWKHGMIFKTETKTSYKYAMPVEQNSLLHLLDFHFSIIREPFAAIIVARYFDKFIGLKSYGLPDEQWQKLAFKHYSSINIFPFLFDKNVSDLLLDNLSWVILR